MQRDESDLFTLSVNSSPVVPVQGQLCADQLLLGVLQLCSHCISLCLQATRGHAVWSGVGLLRTRTVRSESW
jgi:hypothetical protein